MKPGYEAWLTTDHSEKGLNSLNLTRERLGLFVYHLLNLGGDIHDTFTMKAGYHRSFVQMAISLPAGKREELQEKTAIGLVHPPQISLDVE